MRRTLFIGIAIAAAAWPVANGDRASTRAGRTKQHGAVPRVVWRFRLPRAATEFGAVTATPVIAGTTVYLQDSSSAVYALDARTGRLRWTRRFAAPNDGPN